MKRITAIAAVLSLLAGLPAFALPAAAEALPPDWEPPEWVPSNFIEAMDFDNAYGYIHCADGYICFVRTEVIDDTNTYSYDLDISGSILDWECWNTLNFTYAFEMPEKPDENDTEAMQEYAETLSRLGLDPNGGRYELYEGFPGYRYVVTLIDAVPETTIDLTWSETRTDLDRLLFEKTYNFEVAADGSITETDLFGWLPDSITEYKAFTAENKPLSIHNGYVVYADDVCYDGGIDVSVAQEGTALLKVMLNYNISEKMLMYPVGGSGHNVRVFAVEIPGTLKLTVSQSQPFDPTGMSYSESVGCYQAAENGEITEISEEQVEYTDAGDCNGDGAMNLADAVMLHKYLLGSGEITNWRNGDLDNNGRLTAQDLTILKRRVMIEAGIMAEPMKLTTTYQWKAPGMTEFEVQFGAGQLDQLRNVRVFLYDADTGERLAAFTAADDADNWWSCAAEITPAEDCTMHFYAIMEGKLKNANTDTAVVMQSNTVSIEFSQTPPPA